MSVSDLSSRHTLVFLSDDSPFSYDFTDCRVPFNIHHHSPVIVRIVNQAWFGHPSSDTSQSLAYESARLLVGRVFHSRVLPKCC